MKPSFRTEVTQQWIHHAEHYLVHLRVEREGEQEMCGAFDLLRAEWLALSEIFYARGVEIVHKSIAAPSPPCAAAGGGLGVGFPAAEAGRAWRRYQ